MTSQKADGDLEVNPKHVGRREQPTLEVEADCFAEGAGGTGLGLHWWSCSPTLATSAGQLLKALSRFHTCEDKREMGREWQVA